MMMTIKLTYFVAGSTTAVKRFIVKSPYYQKSICNLQWDQISESVCPRQAFQALLAQG
jgi:hypothetical protein